MRMKKPNLMSLVYYDDYGDSVTVDIHGNQLDEFSMTGTMPESDILKLKEYGFDLSLVTWDTLNEMD